MISLAIGLLIGFYFGWRYHHFYMPERIIFKPAPKAPKQPVVEDAEVVDRITPEVWEQCKAWRDRTGGSREKFFEQHYPHLA